jgi:hypothetical protein
MTPFDDRWVTGEAGEAGEAGRRRLAGVPSERDGHGPHGDLRVELHPADGLADEPPAIRVTGAPAGSEVTLVARATDAAGHSWESRCRFCADAGGTVDLARDAPLAGGYAGVDPTGPIWSMALAGGPRRFVSPPQGFALAVTARLPGGAAAGAVAMRRWRARGVACLALVGSGLAGRLFVPPGPGPHPAVALVPGAAGPGGALLASRGYVTLALPSQDRGAAPPAAALAAGLRRLAAHPRVDRRRVAALGVAAGAEALLAGLADAPDLALRAVVAIAPDSAVWRAVVEAPQAPAARLAAPILFLSGDDPQGTAAVAAEALWHRRRGSGHEGQDRYLTVTGAGHGLRPPITPTTIAGPAPGGAAGVARAEAAAWRVILDFLRAHLA